MPLTATIDAKFKALTSRHKILDLSSMEITDDQLDDIIQALEQHSKIRSLNLNGNALTNSSVAKLTAIAQLKELNINNNSITVEACEAFLQNETLNKIVMPGGRSKAAKKIRDHITANKTRKNKNVKAKGKAPAETVSNGEQQDTETTTHPILDVEPNDLMESQLTKLPREFETTGQEDFLALSAMFLSDLSNTPTESKLLLQYSVIVLNHFMHLATHGPMQGYGKVQEREMDAKLQYYRSQTKKPLHPHRQLIEALYRAANPTLSGTSYLPVNSALRRFLRDELTDDFRQKLAAVDKRGYKKKNSKTKLSELGLAIGYTGLRLNHFQSYLQALSEYCDSKDTENISQSVSEIFESQFFSTIPKKLSKLPEERVRGRIDAYKAWFSNNGLDAGFDASVGKDLFLARTSMIQQIATAVGELSKIRIDTVDFNTCMVLHLYPSFTGSERESNNYGEGVTNLIISYFIALLNHNAAQAGLDIIAERRQSFGFLRPTVSDVGSLRIRISMGLEPVAYAEVLVKTIKELNQVLTAHNFERKTGTLLRNCFKVSEKSKSKSGTVTSKTGRKVLTAMRKEEDQWKAVHAAETAIGEVFQSKAKKKKVPEDAFAIFLQRFVVDRIPDYSATKSRAKTSKRQLKPEPYNYHFNSGIEIQSNPDDAIFRLLRNLCVFVQEKISNLPPLTSALAKGLQYTLLHSVQLITKYYQRACEILGNLSTPHVGGLYNHANNCIENLLENMIILQGIYDLELAQKLEEESANSKKAKSIHEHPVIKEFTQSYSKTLSTYYEVEESTVSVFYADSGQQAIITILNAFAAKHALEDSVEHRAALEKVYVSNKSYYEIDNFFNKVVDVGTITTENQSDATIVLVDIQETQALDFTQFEKAKVVIFDMSNFNVHTEAQLKEAVASLRERGIWVIFAESMLKHAQLGLDKYQAGRVTCIAPTSAPEDQLDELTEEVLNNVSEEAVNPNVIRFFQMTQQIAFGPDGSSIPKATSTISEELPQTSTTAISDAALKALPQVSMFANRGKSKIPVLSPPKALVSVKAMTA